MLKQLIPDNILCIILLTSHISFHLGWHGRQFSPGWCSSWQCHLTAKRFGVRISFFNVHVCFFLLTLQFYSHSPKTFGESTNVNWPQAPVRVGVCVYVWVHPGQAGDLTRVEPPSRPRCFPSVVKADTESDWLTFLSFLRKIQLSFIHVMVNQSMICMDNWTYLRFFKTFRQFWTGWSQSLIVLLDLVSCHFSAGFWFVCRVIYYRVIGSHFSKLCQIRKQFHVYIS